jgi:hypothetical protein
MVVRRLLDFSRQGEILRVDTDVNEIISAVLALVHHLAISNNVPLPVLANFLADLSQWLIIEFVPKSDQQVQTLLASREDIFDGYHQEGFEAAFQQRYRIVSRQPVKGMERIIYLMERRPA